MSDDLDPRWRTISRFQPDEVDIETLLKLLKHDEWQVRFNAAREIRFNPDARALPDLLTLFQEEKNSSVRYMVGLALGALHESGVEVPLFTALKNPTPNTRRDIAIKRLRELKVTVSTRHKDYDQLMIPHNLSGDCSIEVGFLIAQLVEIPFPDHHAPISDRIPSAVLPQWSSPVVRFVESYPSGMKFRIYRRPK